MSNSLTKGLSRQVVEELSHLKGEPSWMLERRLQAWDIYESQPMPQGHRGDLGVLKHLAGFQLDSLAPYNDNSDKAAPATVITSSSGRIVQQNSKAVSVELSADLKRQGVIFTDMDTAVREHADLIRDAFMTRIVSPELLKIQPRPDHMQQTEVKVKGQAAASGDTLPMTLAKYAALQCALWSGGTFLYIPKGVEIETPLLAEVLLTSPGAGYFPHTLIIAEAGSSLRYIESLSSDLPEKTQTYYGGLVEIYAREGASVEFNSLQNFGSEVWDTSVRRSVSEKDSSVQWILAELGGGVVATEVGTDLNGGGSTSNVLGVFFADQSQQFQINTLANHISQATSAETLFKGVLNDSAKVGFEGMIKIMPRAQQTNSYLSDHTLHLSDDCRSESIPGLEIEANDVRASHGATSGQIDTEELFYLMCRGIEEKEARRIIVQGFFEPVLTQIPHDELRTRIRGMIAQRMARAYGGSIDESVWHEVSDVWEVEGVDEGAVRLSEEAATPAL